MVHITSRYDGRCGKCGHRYFIGDTIYRVERQWWCSNCGEPHARLIARMPRYEGVTLETPEERRLMAYVRKHKRLPRMPDA